jgi:HK97 family phage portal protein
VESTTAAGLIVREHRAAWTPSSGGPITPNGNDPATVPPATVGPDVARGGDPSGVQLIDEGPGAPRHVVRPSAWSGWPAEWNTPNWWGRVEALTDTAWMCIDLNSSILATMPPYLVGASPSLNADWINNPDPERYNSWHEFMKQASWDFHLGEAFIVATARYSSPAGPNTGYPARFHVVPPWTVNVEVTPGGRRYTIGSLDVTDDILHVPYQITEGEARGHGPLEAGAARMVAAGALARYATSMATAGGMPNAVLTHPGNLNARQAQDLQTAWVEARMASMGLPAVLSGGIDFKPLAFSPRDMALLDISQFVESRIAVLLGVPPFLVGLPSGGDPMTYSNTQWVFLYHWRASLSTKANALMSALSTWLLPRSTTVELNRDEYTKAELLERAQTYATLNGIVDPEGNPVLTVAEIRELERYSNAAPTPALSSGVLQ